MCPPHNRLSDKKVLGLLVAGGPGLPGSFEASKISGLAGTHRVSDTLRVDSTNSPALESPKVRLSLSHRTEGVG